MRYVQAIARPSDRAKLKGVKLAGVAVVVTMLLTGVATSAGAASGPINIAGQWQTSFQCTSGPCTPGDKSDLLTITQAAGSNTISGTDQHGRAIAGTLTGLDLVITVSKGNFVATADVAVSANGQSWSGTLSDTIGTSGTETVTRVSGELGSRRPASSVTWRTRARRTPCSRAPQLSATRGAFNPRLPRRGRSRSPLPRVPLEGCSKARAHSAPRAAALHSARSSTGHPLAPSRRAASPRSPPPTGGTPPSTRAPGSPPPR